MGPKKVAQNGLKHVLVLEFLKLMKFFKNFVTGHKQASNLLQCILVQIILKLDDFFVLVGTPFVKKTKKV